MKVRVICEFEVDCAMVDLIDVVGNLTVREANNGEIHLLMEDKDNESNIH